VGGVGGIVSAGGAGGVGAGGIVASGGGGGIVSAGGAGSADGGVDSIASSVLHAASVRLPTTPTASRLFRRMAFMASFPWKVEEPFTARGACAASD